MTTIEITTAQIEAIEDAINELKNAITDDEWMNGEDTVEFALTRIIGTEADVVRAMEILIDEVNSVWAFLDVWAIDNGVEFDIK